MAKKIPQRQCLGCRQMKPKNELVRIIRTPLDEIRLDVTGKMNGRGHIYAVKRPALTRL